MPALRDAGFLVACPFARGTMGYQGIAEQDVYGVLADVKRRYPVDDDRIYLTGASMGGGGALWLGLTRPDLWAAVVPVCPDPFPGTSELAPNALNLPMRFAHGELDPLVPVEVSRQWQRRPDL
jgi:predicted peptidase